MGPGASAVTPSPWIQLLPTGRIADPRGESMARDAFRVALRGRGLNEGKWRRGKEPPDFYLRWEWASYAVEVARVMDHRTTGAASLPPRGIVAALKELTRQVENEARRTGSLGGTYAMHLAPVADLQKARAAVVAAALSYIQSTAVDVVAPRRMLHRGAGGRSISIEKVAPSGAYVGARMSIDTAKRDPTVVSDLARLIGACLAAKDAALRKVRLPRVLLLIDAYDYGDLEHWKMALGSLDLTQWHTVARIAGRGRCRVLHSRETCWRGWSS